MSDSHPHTTTVAELIEQYSGLLLDGDGTLYDWEGPLPGAREVIARLHASNKPFQIVTNAASRTAATASARFRRWGLDIGPERVTSAGSLLPGWLRERGLAGHRCFVLGPHDTKELARAGGVSVEDAPDEEVDVFIVADEEGYDFVLTIDLTLSALVRRLDQGRVVRLVLANPDLVYPTGRTALGMTAGAIAALIDAVLLQRYGEGRPRFEALGKPSRLLIDDACAAMGTRDVVLIGDQLRTDIAAAHAAGIDAALVLTGLTRLSELRAWTGPLPRWVLTSLHDGAMTPTGAPAR